ncbi:ATP-dependent DNA helicase UvrD/PcrA [Methylorubrum extorquens]
MDAFEVVRSRAAEVHAAAVEGGADPLRPLDLVVAAIDAHEIDLSWLCPGDAYLRGGRGLYDPTLPAIACEDRGDATAKALLAGHELGHAVLHDPDDVIVDVDIDPSRAVEAAATGVEKVEGYARRERRELQADLFARELVLPRALARRLFLEDRHGADDIVRLTGLPQALVFQQLADCLLLPEHRPRAEPGAGAGPPLDDSQRAAAFHEGTPFLLQAGPGTGKTRTLVSRIERLLDRGATASEILVLTFSNKAAGELVERLTARLPEAAAAAWIGTFHGFGLDVLRQFHDSEGLPDDPRLVDKADAVGMLEDLVPRLPLRHYRNLHDPTLDLSDILAAVSRAKDELTPPDEYLALAERMAERAGDDDDARLRAEKAIEVAAVYRVYDAEMRRLGRLDFGDLVMRPTLLLERDRGALDILRAKHRHILVDEYQDVNRASVRLLKALAGGGERLWVVGDSRQSIYRFRGASSANITGFETDFPGAGVGRLTVNYRSSAEVVATFSAFATDMTASRGVLPLDLTAHAGPAHARPETRKVDRPEDEAAAIAARILELRQAHGVDFRDQAVLCRGNARLAAVAAALEQRDVPVLFLGNLFERDEVRDLLALLALLVDSKAGTLARVARMPRYAMPLEDVGRLQPVLARCEEPMGWAKESAALLGPPGAAALANLLTDLRDLGAASHPWEALCRLLFDRRHLLPELRPPLRPRDRMQMVALWQFLAFCRNLPQGQGLAIQRLLDRTRRLVLLSEERDLRQMPAAAAAMDGVRLMTVHASKGLEFEAVHIPGMVGQGFPSSGRTPRCPPPDGLTAGAEGLSGLEAVRRGHAEEEECLFFVAASRARRHLTLLAARCKANGSGRPLSPFLDKVAEIVRDVPDPPLHLREAPEPDRHRIGVAWEGPPSFTAEQISLYDQCPRRFFYTHVLGAAGGRRSTSFVRMHDVVHEILRWLRQDVRNWSLPLEAVRARFDEVWSEKGPTEGYAEDLRRVGFELVEALMRTREGHSPGLREPVTIDLGGLDLVVLPDEVRGEGAATVYRRVRTGRRRKEEEDDLVYTAYLMAAGLRHGAGARVEAIHLSGDGVMDVPLTPKKRTNRERKLRLIAEGILAGEFPPDPDERACPRCPHYVTCGPVPVGILAARSPDGA